jgi:PAS domain S-box-containing protein
VKGALYSSEILLVDADEGSVLPLKALLESEGYRVHAARDGAAALDAVGVRAFDLVLAGIRLPGMDGCELCRNLRSRPGTRHLPVLLMGAETEEELSRCFEAGASDHLAKPVRAPELKARAAHHLALRHASELLLENLHHSELLFKTLFEQASDAIFLYDAEGQLVDVNRRACDLLGYGREELLRLRLDEIDMAMPQRDLLATIEEMTSGGKPVESRGRFLHKKGQEIYVEIMAGPVRSGGKELILSIVRDVTQKRKIEETLYFIAQLRPDGYLDGCFDELTAFLCRILDIEYAIAAQLLPGGRRVRIIGSSAKRDIVFPPEFDLADTPCERVAGKKVCVFPSRVSELFPKDEDLRALGAESYVGVPLWGADGRALGHLAVIGCQPLSETNVIVSILQIAAMRAVQEIEQRTSRAALVKEKTFTHSVFTNLPGMACVVDEGGKLKLWNRNSEELAVGLAVGRPARAILRAVRPVDRRKVLAAFARIGPDGEATVEIPFTTRTGRQFPALCTGVRIDLPEGRYSLCVAMDISAHQETERELHRLAKAIEQAAEAVIITSSDGTIRFVNPAFETLTGNEASEAVGRDIRGVCGGNHGEEAISDLLAAAARAGHWKGRFPCVGKGGAPLVVEATLSAVFDDKGKVVNYISIQRDITKEQELEARLSQAQRLEAIGTLAGGIAHDFNNILTAVMGYTQLAMEEGSGNERIISSLDEVLKAANRAKELVRQILTFSRQGPEEKRPVQIGLIVKESLKLLRASLPSSIEFKTDVSSRSVALADSTQIHQVVMNLCTNAGLSMKGQEGVMTIALKDVEVTEKEAPHPKLSPGPYIRLTVGDTGCGIPGELIDRIFEPFFTTRSDGEGSGMGLSVVHGIVEGHGGAVTVASEVGAGTVFQAYFPRLVAASAPAGGKDVSAIPRGTEKVLFVDDEVSHVNLARRMLGRLGYTVSAVDKSSEALELFLSAPDAFDLLITDLTMPGMRGDDLCRRVLAVRPGFPVILSSGLNDSDTRERAVECGAKGFLLKPFIYADIAARIREVLGR